MHEIFAKSLLTKWNGMNVYRGCTHGCIYCDSRSACYNFDHDFLDVGVKVNAPDLLQKIVHRKRDKIMISSGSMCDPYQPIERSFRLTYKTLSILRDAGFGASIITKSTDILRDIDLLQDINERAKCVVQVSMTCADETLSKMIEPNVSTTKERFEILKECQKRGIPTIVWLTPILPFLTDTKENIDQILSMCIDAGVKGIICFQMGMTLRSGSREYYYSKLDQYFPGLKDKYIHTYGNTQELVSPENDLLMELFTLRCKSADIMYKPEDCFQFTHTMPKKFEQRSLF